MTDTNGTTPAPEGATPSCSRHRWCTHGELHQVEHDDGLHTSSDVALSIDGWSCYLSQHDEERSATLILNAVDGERGLFDVALPAGYVTALMVATEKPEVWQAVWGLLELNRKE